MEKLLKKIYWNWKINRKDPQTQAYKKWMELMGDQTLRTEYPLTTKSKIVDVGGHVGTFAHTLVSLYNPSIYIFEPVKKHYKLLEKQFSRNKKVKIFGVGLSNEEKEDLISVEGLRSSTYTKKGGSLVEIIRLVDVYEFFKKNNLKEVDLFKLNCEGEEYNILHRMIDKDLIKNCKNIQIQFHKISKDSEKLRKEIRTELAKTHKLTYDYYFLMENWKRK